MPTPMYDSVFSGERLGRYELVTRLSLGGMAELFLARLEGPGGFQKLVALKRILPDIARDAHFVTMFLDEAKVAAVTLAIERGIFEVQPEKIADQLLRLEQSLARASGRMR